jgi:hypothetical protein
MLMNLPVQSAPVVRGLVSQGGRTGESGTGVEASQSACDGLTGLAQQMCYALEYGIS